MLDFSSKKITKALKNTIYLKTIFSAFLLVAFFSIRPVLLFIFPGALIFYLSFSKKLSFSEAVVSIIFFSLSYWIVSFWALKIIPLSFSNYINLTFLTSLFLILINHKRKYHLSLPKKADIALLTLALILVIVLGRINLLVAPAGADMATHTYTAKLINKVDGFPKSYRPILPVDGFGSSPFGFSTLTATFSQVSGLPEYRSALFTIFLTYVLFGLALYMFLNIYFSESVSFITTPIIMFGSYDTLQYLSWGGDPTILAISFLIYGLFLAFYLKRESQFSPKSAIILSIPFYAFFTTHHSPFMVAASFIIPTLLIYFFINKVSFKKVVLPFLMFLASLFVMSIPFLSSLKFPSETTLEWIREWQGLFWQGNISNAFITVPEFLQTIIGKIVSLLLALGMLSSFYIKVKHKNWFLLSFIWLFVIILNSRYWLLPFSPLLYPDRAVTVSLISISFFVAACLTLFESFLTKIFKSKILAAIVITAIVMVTPFYGYSLLYESIFRYELFIVGNDKYSSVTKDDLKAFEWISENTTTEDVFDNNYGDAGIWIPAIAFRRVIKNDSGPYVFDELKENKDNLEPNYVYVGSKVLFDNSAEFTNSSLSQSKSAQLVFSSGKAKVYKLIE